MKPILGLLALALAFGSVVPATPASYSALPQGHKYSQTASVTSTATVTGTTTLSGRGALLIPAYSLRAGDVIHIKGWCMATLPANTIPSTQVVWNGSGHRSQFSQVTAGSASTQPYDFEVWYTLRTTGSSGSLMENGLGRAWTNGTTGQAAYLDDDFGGQTLNTTIDQTIDIVQFLDSSASSRAITNVLTTIEVLR